MSKLNASDFISGSTYVYCVGIEELNKELLKALESLVNNCNELPHVHSAVVEKALKVIEKAKQ